MVETGDQPFRTFGLLFQMQSKHLRRQGPSQKTMTAKKKVLAGSVKDHILRQVRRLAFVFGCEVKTKFRRCILASTHDTIEMS